MNKNVNLIKILKGAPKGTKLWSPIFGECEFIRIGCIKGEDYEIPIIETYSVKGYDLKCAITNYADFLEDGKLESCHGEDGECMLFPSKDNRNWETFKAPWMHKHFEPGQRVLIPYYEGNNHKWRLAFYSHYDVNAKLHITTDYTSLPDERVIAYNGNEDKLGKPVK